MWPSFHATPGLETWLPASSNGLPKRHAEAREARSARLQQCFRIILFDGPEILAGDMRSVFLNIVMNAAPIHIQGHQKPAALWAAASLLSATINCNCCRQRRRSGPFPVERRDRAYLRSVPLALSIGLSCFDRPRRSVQVGVNPSVALDCCFLGPIFGDQVGSISRSQLPCAICTLSSREIAASSRNCRAPPDPAN